MITIRQATLADKPHIFDFLEKAYDFQGRHKFPRRWEWEYKNNPFRNKDDLPVWLAVDEDKRIIGQICSMVEPLKVNQDVTIQLFWAVDLIVLPEYRNQKIGFLLSKALYEHNKNICALPMSKAFRHYLTEFSSKSINAVSVYQRLSWIDKESILEAVRSRTVNKKRVAYIPRLVKYLLLDRVLAGVINFYSCINNASLPQFNESEIEIKQVDKFDCSIDEFWAKVSPEYQVIIKRNSEFLNWKYVNQPFMDYKIFIAMKNSAISGYIILRHAAAPESNTGIIADIFTSPKDKTTINSLLKFAVEYFRHHKAKYIQAAHSNQSYKDAFIQFGFKQLRVVVPMFNSLIESEREELLRDNQEWFFGRSDHDWDQFPYS